MNRREFGLMLAITGAWPVAAHTQPTKLKTIGFMSTQPAAAQSVWTSAFVQRLHELGWAEGRNVVIHQRSAEGRPDRYGPIAEEFVAMNVDVIVTSGTSAVEATKKATSTVGEHLANRSRPLEPDGEPLVAYLEPMTPWDS